MSTKTMPQSMEEVARELAQVHFGLEPGMKRIFRLLKRSENDLDFKEPVKLLEVNADTVAAGNGRRPDNCEYPWEAGHRLIAPVDFQFPGLSLLKTPSGSEPLKLVRFATDRKVRELTQPLRS